MLELLSECARDLPPQGRATHRDLLDLHLLPLRQGGLAPVGGGAYLVAGSRPQALLPQFPNITDVLLGWLGEKPSGGP